MPTLPTDTPSSPSSPPAGSLVDPASQVTEAQREQDFNRVFVWHGKELTFSIASEIYYRELRVHMNAPPLGSYATMADFAAEAPRVLYCASQTAQSIRLLRLFSPLQQIEAFDAWAEKNIAFHELDAATELAREIQDAITRARTQPADDGEEVDGLGN